MSSVNVTKQCSEKFTKSITKFREDLSSIRAGRVVPDILNTIIVDVYGEKMRISQLGNISSSGTRSLLIDVWDMSVTNIISNAISTSELGVHPIVEGKVIRLNFPEVTQERRNELSKFVGSKGEEFKIIGRNIRKDAIDEVKFLQKNSEITEDDSKSLKSDIEDLTKDYNKQIEQMVKDKQSEVKTL